MKNFFNAIGVADMEKVHSAMIAWILDDENDPTLPINSGQIVSSFSTFPRKERSELLCKLFNVAPNIMFQSIKTCVEWNDIDILIETKDTNGCDEVWVIENKLKSQEHLSNQKDKNSTESLIWQTEKYEKSIDNSFKNHIKHYLLLSLGGDEAKSTTKLWISKTYKDLEKLLNISILKQHVLVEEYKSSISTITKELEDFLESTCLDDYKHVFKKLKKSQIASALKNNKIGENEKYIVENRLETIFQKQFLKSFVKKANIKELQNNIVIDEDNGIAEFDHTIARFNNTKICDNGDLLLQIQFQNGTFKVVIIHKRYRNNKIDDYKQIYGEFKDGDWQGDWYSKFFECQKKFNNEGWTLYEAKNLKNDKKNKKPRIALDKKMEKDAWYNDIDNFKQIYGEAEKVAESLIDSCP